MIIMERTATKQHGRSYGSIYSAATEGTHTASTATFRMNIRVEFLLQ